MPARHNRRICAPGPGLQRPEPALHTQRAIPGNPRSAARGHRSARTRVPQLERAAPLPSTREKPE